MKLHFYTAIRLIFILSIALTLHNTVVAQQPENNIWQTGICTSLANTAIVKEAGCNYIEESVGGFLIPTEPDEKFIEQLNLAQSLNIRVYACNSFLPSNFKLVGTDTNHVEVLNYVNVALRRAKQANIQLIVLGSGRARNIPPGFDKNLATKQFISLASKIADIAHQNGIIVCLEALNSAETNFINTLDEALEIVKTVNSPNLMLIADLYHIMRENDGPEVILRAAKYIAHCHVAEKEGRTPPGVMGDDFTPYLFALKSIGYKGNISMECKWSNLSTEALDGNKTLVQQINKVAQSN